MHLALLRGINVGGKHKLPMRDLVGFFEGAGAHDVRTYIQSGNVLFAAASPTTVADAVRKAIARTFGFDVPLVLRSLRELAAAVRHNPFAKADADPKALAVGFLADRPSAARVRTLDPARSPPDAFVVRGRELYLHLPNGAARSKLTNAYFDAQLGTVSTMRSWSTTLALLELGGVA